MQMNGKNKNHRKLTQPTTRLDLIQPSLSLFFSFGLSRKKTIWDMANWSVAEFNGQVDADIQTLITRASWGEKESN